MSNLRALVLVLAPAGCAQLTAERPLFSVSDQVGPAPLSEGVWVAIGEDCPERNARRSGRFPKECTPIEITQTSDGAWNARYRPDLASGFTHEERLEADQRALRTMQFVLAPAVERRDGDTYAPLYVAEIRQSEPGDDGVSYAVIAPLGAMPATTMAVLSGIDCSDALRDSPIEGVEAQYTERIDETGAPQQQLSGCVASSQTAVREAARRALIENIPTLHEHRYVYARQRAR